MVTDRKVTIRPIKTGFKGIQFRSKLEGRWAVFFEALGLAWEYEPKLFKLPGVHYLPDFYLKDLRYWVEIKPNRPTPMEQNKARLLSIQTRRPVAVLFGSVGELLGDNNWIYINGKVFTGFHWGRANGRAALVYYPEPDNEIYSAYRKARAAFPKRRRRRK